MHACSVDRAAHHWFEGLPFCWWAERQPVGATHPDGAGATSISVRHTIHRGENSIDARWFGLLGSGNRSTFACHPVAAIATRR